MMHPAKDFIVTYFVPIRVRVENVEDADLAAGIAAEYLVEDQIMEAIDEGLDATRFSVDHLGWARTMTTADDIFEGRERIFATASATELIERKRSGGDCNQDESAWIKAVRRLRVKETYE